MIFRVPGILVYHMHRVEPSSKKHMLQSDSDESSSRMELPSLVLVLCCDVLVCCGCLGREVPCVLCVLCLSCDLCAVLDVCCLLDVCCACVL